MTFIIGGGQDSVGISDGPNLDSFGRLRVSSPTSVFDSQLTYDLQPLLFEQVKAETGAAIAHDATNRCALNWKEIR